MGKNLFASYCHSEIPLKILCIFAFSSAARTRNSFMRKKSAMHWISCFPCDLHQQIPNCRCDREKKDITCRISSERSVLQENTHEHPENICENERNREEEEKRSRKRERERSNALWLKAIHIEWISCPGSYTFGLLCL